MNIRYHLIYIAVILVLGTLLVREYWWDYQVEREMEVMNEIISPSLSELTDDELLEQLKGSVDHIQILRNSIKESPELLWVANFDGKTRLSLVSPRLYNNIDLFNSTENTNFDYLDFYNDVEVKLMKDSLVITSADSIICATRNWTVEFDLEKWLHVLRITFPLKSSSTISLNQLN